MNDETPPVLEPELLPPEHSIPRSQRASGEGPGRFSLLIIGILLDLLDLLTHTIIGIKIGLPLGFIGAFLLFSLSGMPLRRRLLYSLLVGVYCAVPGTEVIPLGTIMAVLMKQKPD